MVCNVAVPAFCSRQSVTASM